MTCRSAALRRTAVALGQGQSALASAPSPAGGSAGDPDVFRLGSLLALGDVELDLLPFLQAAVAATGDRAEVDEHGGHGVMPRRTVSRRVTAPRPALPCRCRSETRHTASSHT